MYYLDSLRDKDGGNIYRTKSGFKYPLSKDRSGQYKVKSGEMIRVCMTSDFFLEEADPWGDEAWEIIKQRPDVKFFLLTKRPERVKDHLPWDWDGGWENVMLNVSYENQRRADERIPILFELPFKHKGRIERNRQKTLCQQFIDESEWLLTGEFWQKENNVMDAPPPEDLFPLLCWGAEHKLFDILLVSEFDRIARFPMECSTAAAFFEKHNVEVWSAEHGHIGRRLRVS